VCLRVHVCSVSFRRSVSLRRVARWFALGLRGRASSQQSGEAARRFRSLQQSTLVVPRRNAGRLTSIALAAEARLARTVLASAST
jgi:hypothetical protein